MTRADQRYEGFNEAEVPDLLPPKAIQQLRSFVDTNRLRAPETLTRVFVFESKIRPFTFEEQLVFTAAFKETPKEFGKIAAVLPGRTEKECIRHYYDNKGDGRFKTTAAKDSAAKRQGGGEMTESLPKIGKSRKKQAAVGRSSRIRASSGLTGGALLSQDGGVNDQDTVYGNPHHTQWTPDTPPIDQELARLNDLVPHTGKLWRKAYPLLAQEPTVIPRPDLTVLRQSFDERSPFHLTDEQLLVWLRSGDVLPLLKEWKKDCLDVGKLYLQLQHVLPPKNRPWVSQASQVAEYAKAYGTREVELTSANSVALLLCARSIQKICNGNSNFFEQLAAYRFPEDERYVAASRVISSDIWRTCRILEASRATRQISSRKLGERRYYRNL